MGVRVAVVGTCGSGKSTIVSELREQGIDAYVVSQEHSAIRDLWKHLSPDMVVTLNADYSIVQERRGPNWPRWLYDLQQQRIADARHHSTLEVDTGSLSVQETVARINAVLAVFGSEDPSG